MSDENIQDKLEKIRLSYITTLADKRKNIIDFWQILKTDWNQETYDNIFMIIHGIAGSAETFGLPELTQTARIAVDHLKLLQTAPANQELIDEMENKITTLTALMNSISNS